MILTIQFRKDKGGPHEQQCIERCIPAGENIRFVSIFDESVDFSDPVKLLKPYDKLILGGSGVHYIADGHKNNDYEEVEWLLNRIEPLMNYVLKTDFPTFGACFGHHIIAYFLGSKPEYKQSGIEAGFTKITLSNAGLKEPIFKGVPRTFDAVVGHKDSAKLPKGCIHLAESDRCKNQVFRYKNNVYGFQFHGELDTEDLLFRLRLYPDWQEDYLRLKDEQVDTPHATKVLENFLNM